MTSFHGVKKMPSQKFYCEADWHDDAEPRGPLHDGRYEIAIEARSWPDAKKRPLRVTNAAASVTFATGDKHLLPGHVCGPCLTAMQEGLRPDAMPGQKGLWG